jgi:kinesin family protein 20
METGFDENSHVMKFAAVAKDVKTWQQIQPKLDLQSLRGAGMFIYIYKL